jgi:DNA-binding MarR family transcriptional regulator
MDHNANDMDEVDRIVLAWAKERPDVDLSPMHVFSRVTRLAVKAGRRRDAALRPFDLKQSEASVLSALVCAGPPYERNAGDLARECSVSTGTLTKRIERLMRRNLVNRNQDGEDGRVVTIRLTATGKRVADQAMSASLKTDLSWLSALSRGERRQLATLLRKINVEAERL